jgi:hypothetical protein
MLSRFVIEIALSPISYFLTLTKLKKNDYRIGGVVVPELGAVPGIRTTQGRN